jgi:hypothetical protein
VGDQLLGSFQQQWDRCFLNGVRQQIAAACGFANPNHF